MADERTPPNSDDEPTTVDGLAAMLRNDQRLRWQQGQPVRVEAYLEHYPHLADKVMALRHLVDGEIILLLESGQQPSLEVFQTRFPALSPWLIERFSHLSPTDKLPSDSIDRPDQVEVPWPEIPGYEIIAEIGRGGMGAVFKARQQRLHRFVALKVLIAGATASPGTIARFRREAEAVAQLQHPYIVQLFDVIESHSQLILSTEYVGGGTLARRINGRPLPVATAADFAEKLAQALAFAHERGFIHRDVKPGNVLLTDDGIPKITDFGLAKKIDDEDWSRTKTGTVMGTPDYMAPEQAEGRSRDIGPATDVYALGVVLYEMLTGRPPFRDEALVRVLDAVRFRKPTPLREKRPEIPRDLESICLKCLEKNPAHRYPNAGALAADLANYLAGRPVTAGSRSFWRRILDRFA